jgi:hypothetical protein
MASQSDDLQGLLQTLMSNDNTARRQAEAQWDALKAQQPDALLGGLCRLLALTHVKEAEPLRAMAAVLIRSLFNFRSDFWSHLTPGSQASVRAALLQAVTNEPARHVRSKLSHTVGQLASICLINGGNYSPWPELLPTVTALCQDSSALAKEAGLGVVDRLAEYCSRLLEPHAAGLVALFGSCLQSTQQLPVRVAALKAACSYLHDLEGAQALQAYATDIIPLMLSVVELTVVAGEEDVTRDALSALAAIAERQPRLLKPNLEPISHLMLALAKSEQLDQATRRLALEFLVSLCENASGTVRRRAGYIVEAMVPLMLDLVALVEDDSPEEVLAWARRDDRLEASDGDMEDDSDEVSMAAAESLDRVAMALGGEVVLSVAAPIVSAFADNSDWRRRRAALLALAMLGEGCRDEMYDQLTSIVPPILRFVSDPSPRVRYQLLHCIAQMSLDFAEGDGQPSFQTLFHADVLPVIYESLKPDGINAGLSRILAVAAGTLYTFCQPEHCRRYWVAPMASPLLGSLLTLASTSPSLVVREECVVAASQLSQILGPVFAPYYESFLPPLKQMLMSSVQGSEAEKTALQGRAMEAVVLMGQSVGPARFQADAHELVRCVLEPACATLKPGDALAPFVFGSVARIANALKGEFAPYLPSVIPPLLAALSTGAAITLLDNDAGGLLGRSAQEETLPDGVSTMECEIRGMGNQRIAINTAAMQDKRVACQVLGQMAAALEVEFAPYAPRVLSLVLPNLKAGMGVTDGVRTLTCAMIPRLLASAAAAHLLEAQAMLEATMSSLLTVLAAGPLTGPGGGPQEGHSPCGVEEMEPFCIAADSFCSTLKIAKERAPTISIPDASFQQIIKGWVAVAAQSIDRSNNRSRMAAIAAAEAAEGGGEDFYDEQTRAEDEEEWERDLLTSCVDGIGWVIKAKGEAVLPLFESTLYPLAEALLREGQPEHLRHFALCMCVDVTEHCGAAASPLVPELLPTHMAILRDSMETPDLRQVAAYGMGILAERGDPSFIACAGSCLALLMAIVKYPDSRMPDHASATDNCVAAALKILALHEDHIQPLKACDVMSTLLMSLPLREDIAEGQVAHKLVIKLAEEGSGLVLGQEVLPHFIHFLLNVMAYNPTDDEAAVLYLDDEGDAFRNAAQLGLTGSDEPTSDMWERQLLDQPTRYRAEVLLQKMQGSQPALVSSLWSQLDEHSQKWAHTPTIAFEAQVVTFRETGTLTQ